MTSLSDVTYQVFGDTATKRGQVDRLDSDLQKLFDIYDIHPHIQLLARVDGILTVLAPYSQNFRVSGIALKEGVKPEGAIIERTDEDRIDIRVGETAYLIHLGKASNE